jgi:hypothetical protein
MNESELGALRASIVSLRRDIDHLRQVWGYSVAVVAIGFLIVAFRLGVVL